jgi:hypothetical protein
VIEAGQQHNRPMLSILVLPAMVRNTARIVYPGLILFEVKPCRDFGLKITTQK